ncbi:MAG: dTDP-4-amino-4,6-dideoxygalactose transaminase [Phycisphaera sp.]|nr:dTDP-4-amino-4,6-dideoxygalactose transaminase [Phycisphaera sp.]
MTDIRIPFNKPALIGNEVWYMQDAVQRMHISGDGHYSKLCHRHLEELLGVHRALLTTSCTTALELAAILLEIGPGDEVIMPSFTFVSTANAFALRGATIRFAEVLPDTLNIDPEDVRRLVGPRTKAIVPVHYAGVPCDMDELMSISAAHGIAVVEDAAQGLGSAYHGRPLGSIGHLAALSFHETKNVICGEGGAILINDPELVERAEIIREKGTNRAAFFRGDIDKYTWCGLGGSMLPSDLLAAFLFAQLERADDLNERRRGLWSRYLEGLSSIGETPGVTLPHVPERTSHNGHLFALRVRDLEARTVLIEALRARGIGAPFHYVPLHLSPMGAQMGYVRGDLPITEREAERLLRLPLYPTLTESEQQEVIEAVEEDVGRSHPRVPQIESCPEVRQRFDLKDQARKTP